MRTNPAITLSNGSTGINRYSAEARRNDVADALNLINVEGFVQRRPAYYSMAAGPVFPRPARLSRVVYDAGGGVRTEVSGRTLASTTVTFSADRWVYVGSPTQFDGVDLTAYVPNGGSASVSKVLALQYWNGTAWTAVPFFLDSTIAFRNGSRYHETLARGGRLHWHELSDWASILSLTASGAGIISHYWVRFRPVEKATDRSAINPEFAWNIVAPGILVFDREPVTGLFPVTVQGKRTLLMAGDRKLGTGLGGGANLGAYDYSGETRELNLLSRRSAGVWGSHTTPNVAGPGVAASNTTVGTAARITDQGRGLYGEVVDPTEGLYLKDRPYGNIAIPEVAATGGTVRTLVHVDTRLAGLKAGDLDGYLLEITDPGLSGITAGETRQIYGFDPTSNNIQVYDDFSAAVTNTVVASILRPSALLYVQETGREYVLGALDPASNLLVPDETRPFAPHLSDDLGSSAIVTFELREDTRRAVSKGGRWTAAFNEATREIVMVNGGRPLAYDGTRLRVLEVEPANGPLVGLFVGELQGLSSTGFGAEYVNATAKFRSAPPQGHLIASFGGRLVIADEKVVRWSAPHSYTAIWPLVYEALIRDGKSGRITTMAPLYDKLIVSTKAAIFEGQLVEGGAINFRPVAQGAGFVSHAATMQAAIGQQDVLIGPAADGLILYAAGEPIYLIDDWNRVIAGGISEYSLDQAVGTVWRQRGLYLMAFGRKTSGQLGNDRILVYDYVRKQAFVWDAPWGVSSMSTVIGSGGREFVIIGTDDGFVQRLVSSDLDDNHSVINSVLELHPVQPFGGKAADFKRVNLTARALGRGQGIDLTVRLDDKVRPWSSGAVPLDIGQLSFGSALTPWESAVWPAGGDLTVPINLPHATRGRAITVRLEATTNVAYKEIELEMLPLSAEKR